MEDWLGHPAVMAPLGAAVGLIGTLIGAGGGFFIVPYLILVFDVSPSTASGTSLWLVMANSISSSIRNARAGDRIDYRLGLVLAAFTIPGAAAGPLLLPRVPAVPFQIAFAVLLSVLAGYAAFFDPAGGPSGGPPKRRLALGGAVSLGTGLVSSMFGIGGGLIHVPLMMFGFGMAAAAATATSHFCLIFTSTAGAAGFAIQGQSDWTKIALLAPGIVLGSQAGVWASTRVSRATVRRLLAGVCLLVAVRLALRALL